MFWLIHKDVLRQMQDQRRTVELTADEQRAHEERVEARGRDSGPRSLRIASDVAEIRVEGVLTKHPDFWAWLLGLGNTTYSDLIEAIAVAKSDPAVKRVELYIDSPGGEASGLFDTFAALQDLRATKPVTVTAASAYSAAYGIAAVAGPIKATNAAAMFGSVGVATQAWLRDNIVSITNTESPDKRPDLSTEEGRAVVVRELDAIFDLFAEAIADGRTSAGANVSREDVADRFGRGASFVAGDAKKRGMIDSVAKPVLRAVATTAASAATKDHTNASANGGSGRNRKMDLNELRSQHPELYAEAVQVGVTQERDRVCAHLEMGEQSGDTKTAFGAIRDGSQMTQTLTAKYLVAGMNRSDQATRQTESDAAGAAADGAEAPPAPTADLGDQVVAMLKQGA